MVSRRGLISLLCAGLVPAVAQAAGDLVPLALQARLVVKVVKYDKNFARRVGQRVLIVVVHDPNQADSQHAARALKHEFEEIGEIAGLPIAVDLFALGDVVKLRNKVDAERAAIVYLTPGLRGRAAAVSRALGQADVLSVSALAEDVKDGVVLGFELVSSQPKLWVNLTAAQRQNVMFDPQALRLMKVVR